MMTFDDAVPRIMAARRFSDLTVAETSAERAYRKLAKIVHPDAATDKRRATTAFARLADLYHQERAQGKRWPLFAAGDIANLYQTERGHLMKVPRDPGDNDLMMAEAAALKKLHRDGDPKFRAYAPGLVESFTHEDDQRRRRIVNVVERQGGCISLDEVMRRRGVLDARDAAWIFRRLLVALGWAHRAGVVHGAVLPRHVLIQPEERGVVLVDWCYAGQRPQVIVKEEKAAYPVEVLRDRRAGPATDVFMAAGLVARLVGPCPPEPLRRFVRGCRFEAPRMRPQDAWSLLGELDEMLHGLYGPRKFAPFRV